MILSFSVEKNCGAEDPDLDHWFKYTSMSSPYMSLHTSLNDFKIWNSEILKVIWFSARRKFCTRGGLLSLLGVARRTYVPGTFLTPAKKRDHRQLWLQVAPWWCYRKLLISWPSSSKIEIWAPQTSLSLYWSTRLFPRFWFPPLGIYAIKHQGLRLPSLLGNALPPFLPVTPWWYVRQSDCCSSRVRHRPSCNKFWPGFRTLILPGSRRVTSRLRWGVCFSSQSRFRGDYGAAGKAHKLGTKSSDIQRGFLVSIRRERVIRSTK